MQLETIQFGVSIAIPFGNDVYTVQTIEKLHMYCAIFH